MRFGSSSNSSELRVPSSELKSPVEIANSDSVEPPVGTVTKCGETEINDRGPVAVAKRESDRAADGFLAAPANFPHAEREDYGVPGTEYRSPHAPREDICRERGRVIEDKA